MQGDTAVITALSKVLMPALGNACLTDTALSGAK